MSNQSSGSDIDIRLLEGRADGPRQAVMKGFSTAVTVWPRLWLSGCSREELCVPGVCIFLSRTLSMDLSAYVCAAANVSDVLGRSLPFEREGLYWSEVILVTDPDLPDRRTAAALAERLCSCIEECGNCLLSGKEYAAVSRGVSPRDSALLNILTMRTVTILRTLGYDIFSILSSDPAPYELQMETEDGRHAYAVFAKEGFVVLAGSHACPAPEDTPFQWLLREPFFSAVDGSGTLQTDLAFPTPRHAALFVTGGRTSSPYLWKDRNGSAYFSPRSTVPAHAVSPLTDSSGDRGLDREGVEESPYLDFNFLVPVDINEIEHIDQLSRETQEALSSLCFLPDGRVAAPPGMPFSSVRLPSIPPRILRIRIRMLSSGQVVKGSLTVPVSFSSLRVAAAVFTGGATVSPEDEASQYEGIRTLSRLLHEDVFILEGKGYHACARWKAGSLLVLAGATLNPLVGYSPDSTRDLRREMTADGRIQGNVLAEDTYFPTLAEGQAFVYGRTSGSTTSWKDSSGCILRDFLSELKSAGVFAGYTPRNTVEYPSALQGVEFTLDTDRVSAAGYPCRTGFTVREGSQLLPVDEQHCSSRIQALWRQLAAEGSTAGGRFTRDVLFLSHTDAAACITGGKTAAANWTASNGMSLAKALKRLSSGESVELPAPSVLLETASAPPAESAPVREESFETGRSETPPVPDEEDEYPESMLLDWSWDGTGFAIPERTDASPYRRGPLSFPEGVTPKPGVYYLPGNTCFASGVRSEAGFTVLAGSSVAPGLTSLASRRIQTARVSLRRQGKLKDNVFTEDVLFPSMDAAAECISGITGPNLPGWVDMNGRPWWFNGRPLSE